eukprot:4553741-Lingulodinium_polyedra.AAC.1
MGVTCIINGITDPMCIVTNANTSADHSRTTSGSTYKDPGSGSANYAHISTREKHKTAPTRAVQRTIYTLQTHGVLPGRARL